MNAVNVWRALPRASEAATADPGGVGEAGRAADLMGLRVRAPACPCLGGG